MTRRRAARGTRMAAAVTRVLAGPRRTGRVRRR